MAHRVSVCWLLLPALGCPAPPAPPAPPADDLPVPTSLIDEVDVFHGTGIVGFGVGSTYPGPALPFGLAHPGPDTQGETSTLGALHCSGYSHGDPWVAGFSHLRPNGMGVPDYGVVATMPTVGWSDGKRTATGHRARKNFATEAGEVGYYVVDVESGDAGVPEPITVELTTGRRAALHRVTWPVTAQAEARLILDLAHTIPQVAFEGGELRAVGDDGREWAGWMHFSGPYSGRHGGETVYVVFRVDRAPLDAIEWTIEETGGLGSEGVGLGAALRFDVGDGAPLHVAVGLSFVDEDGARGNLSADLGADPFDFDGVRAAARREWEPFFDTLQVGGGGEEERAIFASSAYHAFLMPSVFTDADGRYRSFGGDTRIADGWTFYSDFSLWDTYRVTHPLYDLVIPELEEDFLRSLYAMYEDLGHMERWPLGTGPTGGMLGDSGANVFAGAMSKGIGLDSVGAAAALEAFEVTATLRAGAGSYFDLGYVASDTSGGSVSETLEFSWNDAALARLALVAGDPARASELELRSQNWRHHWDPETQFLRGRDSAGEFITPFFEALQMPEYVEGSAWQYLWMAPHDAAGYVELFGNAEDAVRKLERFFLEASWELEENPIASLPSAYYWHGNEPDIHASFLFALWGRPDLTAVWSRWAADTQYAVGPEGLVGNDDGGTMGAWYVWAALGLYPIAGTDDFILGAPRFPSARVRVQDASLLVTAPGIEAAGGAGPPIPTGATLNGLPVGPLVTWEQLRDGGELRFAF